ncbi:MAG: TRAP transporter small permease [Spirochaetales bacterium]|jgi:TRAP-type C4-dicarboxylate transport system permease small subunit|nr:TRAP transporter small permease [Spirochaetales bacterium]
MIGTKIEEFFVVVSLAALIILVFLAALLRWFGIAVAWYLDVAQMLFAWITFIGADLALRKSKHIGVDILVTKLPEGVQKALAFVCYLLMLLFLAIVVFHGAKLCVTNYERKFDTVQVSYSFVTAAAPVGCSLMFITVIRHIAGFFTAKSPT